MKVNYSVVEYSVLGDYKMHTFLIYKVTVYFFDGFCRKLSHITCKELICFTVFIVGTFTYPFKKLFFFPLHYNTHFLSPSNKLNLNLKKCIKLIFFLLLITYNLCETGNFACVWILNLYFFIFFLIR